MPSLAKVHHLHEIRTRKTKEIPTNPYEKRDQLRQESSDMSIKKNNSENINQNDTYQLKNGDVDKLIEKMTPLILEKHKKDLTTPSLSKGVVILKKSDVKMLSIIQTFYIIGSIISSVLITLTVVNVLPVFAGTLGTVTALSFLAGVYSGEKDWKRKNGTADSSKF